MRFLILLFITLSSASIEAQTVEIPKEDYPFYSIIEWKGNGAILMNRDPDLKTRKINLTLASNESTLTWKQSFNPKAENAFYITSENARYVYFLDNLELTEDGKYSYHQLNSAGNIKSSSTSLLSTFKKLGKFDLADIELIDVVTTDKALVHIFRHTNSKDKVITEIATFMTHHNLVTYAAIIGETSMLALKENLASHWSYIGSTGDQIYFASRNNQTKKTGWTVKEFSSKSALNGNQFIGSPETKFDHNAAIPYGATGAYYLKRKEEIFQSGILKNHNNQFYVTGITNTTTKAEAHILQLIENKWETVQKHALKLVKPHPKTILKIGVDCINEGFLLKLENKSLNHVMYVPLKNNVLPALTQFKENMLFNPSRFILTEKPQDFAVILQDRILFFDNKQLMNVGDVKFEVSKK